MSLSRRSRPPLPDLVLLQREVNQLFERLAEYQSAEAGSTGEWRPSVDVYECRGRLIVLVEVPGVPPDALQLAVKDRELIVAGERRAPRPQGENAAFLCVERPHGRFRRVVPLESAVDVQRAEARLEQGLLVVELPRVKERRGRETVITVEHKSS